MVGDGEKEAAFAGHSLLFGDPGFDVLWLGELVPSGTRADRAGHQARQASGPKDAVPAGLGLDRLDLETGRPEQRRQQGRDPAFDQMPVPEAQHARHAVDIIGVPDVAVPMEVIDPKAPAARRVSRGSTAGERAWPSRQATVSGSLAPSDATRPERRVH